MNAKQKLMFLNKLYKKSECEHETRIYASMDELIDEENWTFLNALRQIDMSDKPFHLNDDFFISSVNGIHSICDDDLDLEIKSMCEYGGLTDNEVEECKKEVLECHK